MRLILLFDNFSSPYIAFDLLELPFAILNSTFVIYIRVSITNLPQRY